MAEIVEHFAGIQNLLISNPVLVVFFSIVIFFLILRIGIFFLILRILIFFLMLLIFVSRRHDITIF